MATNLVTFLTVVAFILAATPAFPNFSKTRSEQRRKLFLAATLSLFPITVKVLFSVFPLIEARVMPIAFYTPIQREFWLPFAILFFAFASHLVPIGSRKGVLALVIILVSVAASQAFWHLHAPDIYDYMGKITKGVCQQTSFDTCGAASMVTLLYKKGIQASEGEMARLAMAAPGKGISPHQAAYALSKKLEKLDRSEKAAVLAPNFEELRELPKPFLGGGRFLVLDKSHGLHLRNNTGKFGCW